MLEVVSRNLSDFKYHAKNSSLSPMLAYKRKDSAVRLKSKIRMMGNLSGNKVYPTNLSIETTPKCNAKCIMCPRTIRKVNRERKLTLSDIVDIIDSTPHFTFIPSAFGEPLLDEHMVGYIRYAHKHGKMTRLITNASLLNCGKAIGLMEAGLDVFVFSVHGVDKETYETICPGLGWERTLSNLGRLKQFRKDWNFKTLFTMNVVKVEENKNSIEEIVKFWFPHIDYLRVATATRHWKELKETKEYTPLRFCPEPWEMMVVFSDGTVPLCCRDVEGEYSFGNVLKESPMKVWNSKDAQMYRRRIAMNCNPEICNYCEQLEAYEYYLHNGQLVDRKWRHN